MNKGELRVKAAAANNSAVQQQAQETLTLQIGSVLRLTGTYTASGDAHKSDRNCQQRAG